MAIHRHIYGYYWAVNQKITLPRMRPLQLDLQGKRSYLVEDQQDTNSIMIDKIRQLFLSIIGVAAFGFVFYLVFKDDRRFMIGLAAVVVGLILIVLLIGLIGRIRDSQVEKKRRKPFNP